MLYFSQQYIPNIMQNKQKKSNSNQQNQPFFSTLKWGGVIN